MISHDSVRQTRRKYFSILFLHYFELCQHDSICNFVASSSSQVVRVTSDYFPKTSHTTPGSDCVMYSVYTHLRCLIDPTFVPFFLSTSLLPDQWVAAVPSATFLCWNQHFSSPSLSFLSSLTITILQPHVEIYRPYEVSSSYSCVHSHPYNHSTRRIIRRL